MTGGWRAQLNRVRRWYRRLSAATEPADRHDFLYAFFENAFHLRDWLKDTGAVSEQDLDAFFAANEEMRLCRDLTNAHKHHSLMKLPSQRFPPSEAREHTPRAGNLEPDASLVILSDGKKHDAFELAGRVLRLWEAFIAAKVPKSGNLTSWSAKISSKTDP